MNKLRTLVFEWLLFFIAFIVAAAIAEFGLRWFGPTSDRHYVLPPNEHRTLLPIQEHIQGVSGESHYITSSLGIRGAEFAQNEYRILAIGGSTTQNVYLDQSETWTILTGQMLGETTSGAKTWSGDVGRSGHTARSHVLQFEYLIPELPKIDVVVILVGVNDLTVTLRQGMKYSAPPPLSDENARRTHLTGSFVQVPGKFHDRQTMYQQGGISPVKQLALYQLGSTAKATWHEAFEDKKQDTFGNIYQTWRLHRQAAGRIIDVVPNLSNALKVYRNYLEEIADLASKYGVRLIYLTQPTLWRKDLNSQENAVIWLGGVGNFQDEPGHEYFSSRVLTAAMKAYNETLLAICQERNLACVDMAALLPKNLDVFYDDVHLTEFGSRLVAENLAKYLSKHPPYRPNE